MATKTLRNENGSRRTGSIGTVATFIGIYTAFYLAVIGVIHFMSSPDAMAAIAPDAAVQQGAAPHVPPEAIGASGGLPAAHHAEPAAASAMDNSRECTRDAGVETECIYN